MGELGVGAAGGLPGSAIGPCGTGGTELGPPEYGDNCIVDVAAGCAGPLGLSERNSRLASPDQKLSPYCAIIVSQTRRAASG